MDGRQIMVKALLFFLLSSWVNERGQVEAWISCQPSAASKLRGGSHSSFSSSLLKNHGNRRHDNPAPVVETVDENELSLSYDVAIIGAGASGLFASGASTLLGQKCALIDLDFASGDTTVNTDGVSFNSSSSSSTLPSIKENNFPAVFHNVGGDCTNSACVPSKALRSIAQQQRESKDTQQPIAAWDYIQQTVQLVRQREDPKDIQERNSGVTVHLVKSCHFVEPQQRQDQKKKHKQSPAKQQPILQLVYPNQTVASITASHFVLATGASPVVPNSWKQEADKAGILLFNYRTVLRPEWNAEFWSWFQQRQRQPSSLSFIDDAMEGVVEKESRQSETLAIVGGGATACELGQALARLSTSAVEGSKPKKVIMVAPKILPDEDDALSEAARNLLINEGIDYIPGRLLNILPDKRLLVSTEESSNNSTTPSLPKEMTLSAVDAILVCTGRSPKESLESLNLAAAGVAWNENGVAVNPHTLQSLTQPRCYAIGDCADAIPPRHRTASQAAWTGFHAIRNIVVPWVLRAGSPSVHPCVPRVIYTDPELACVGLTKTECDARYGSDRYDSVLLYEDGSDRADMERAARNTSLSFLELRTEKGGGKVLGITCCGPAAAEMANSVGIAISNKLTARDIARSVHSYPSYGYLLHRVALSMALSDVWGLLETCGPVGLLLARCGRGVQSLFRRLAALFSVMKFNRKATAD